jgi:hypothetical protein
MTQQKTFRFITLLTPGELNSEWGDLEEITTW